MLHEPVKSGEERFGQARGATRPRFSREFVQTYLGTSCRCRGGLTSVLIRTE